MKKVICIDASGCSKITEGVVYTASEGLTGIDIPNYFIHEANHAQPYYAKDRFIPLSEIDETELAN